MIVQLLEAVAGTSGGKASSLGTLLRVGLPVPDGFVVPFGTRSDTLLEAVTRGLGALGDAPVAVRSSASDEDTSGSSAAGQHESFLAVHGADAVVAAVRACWASLHAPRAVAYRAGRGRPPSEEPAMAVLVQRLVDADVSGVMFTPAAADDATEIEASWGLGPSVVGGTVTPDAYRVTTDGTVTRTVADKPTRLDRGYGRLVRRDVASADRDRATLDDPTVLRLARLGREIAATLGGPQDVEWALAGDRLWILQARPVTAAPPPTVPAPPPPGRTTPAGAPAGSPRKLTGTPGSHGTATGTARLVRGPADFDRVAPGDILVCRLTDPAWTPLLRIAAGVVTETGGVLSHAAIVARELRTPAVLGVPQALDRIADDSTVTIDGAAGTITLPAA